MPRQHSPIIIAWCDGSFHKRDPNYPFMTLACTMKLHNDFSSNDRHMKASHQLTVGKVLSKRAHNRRHYVFSPFGAEIEALTLTCQTIANRFHGEKVHIFTDAESLASLIPSLDDLHSQDYRRSRKGPNRHSCHRSLRHLHAAFSTLRAHFRTVSVDWTSRHHLRITQCHKLCELLHRRAIAGTIDHEQSIAELSRRPRANLPLNSAYFTIAPALDPAEDLCSTMLYGEPACPSS